MVHILFDRLDFSADFLYQTFRHYLHLGDTVVIPAFSYRDSDVHSLADWNRLYNPRDGLYYHAMTGPFLRYGIPESQIHWINAFTDSKARAAELIRNADILYLPGGLPDRMLERMDAFDLRDSLLRFQGVMMGYSAGALIQLEEYHLSPDSDYPEFSYHPGLPLLKDFYLEVHYQGAPAQDQAIRRVLKERRKKVYATVTDRSAILIDGSETKLLGNVRIFTPASSV